MFKSKKPTESEKRAKLLSPVTVDELRAVLLNEAFNQNEKTHAAYTFLTHKPESHLMSMHRVYSEVAAELKTYLAGTRHRNLPVLDSAVLQLMSNVQEARGVKPDLYNFGLGESVALAQLRAFIICFGIVDPAIVELVVAYCLRQKPYFDVAYEVAEAAAKYREPVHELTSEELSTFRDAFIRSEYPHDNKATMQWNALIIQRELMARAKR